MMASRFQREFLARKTVRYRSTVSVPLMPRVFDGPSPWQSPRVGVIFGVAPARRLGRPDPLVALCAE